MTGDVRPVAIHYRRPGKPEVVYRQWILHSTADVIVTFQPDMEVGGPFEIGGEVVLEAGSAAVWFTFPSRSHDIGRFHDRTGRFTGIYANVLTPVEMDAPPRGEVVWRTTDLFLDIFRTPSGRTLRLDEDELRSAEAAGLIGPELALRARTEADRIETKIGEGTWPPPIVDEWPLERARAVLESARPEGHSADSPDPGPRS